jgi:hypothetical protein
MALGQSSTTRDGWEYGDFVTTAYRVIKSDHGVVYRNTIGAALTQFIGEHLIA